MWEFGNEYDVLFTDHPEWLSLDAWWVELKRAAAETHRIDPKHLVSTAQADVNFARDIPKADAAGVDVIGFNIYWWDNGYDKAAKTDTPIHYKTNLFL